MSKMDAQRAMREAKWARTQARAAQAATTPAGTRPRPPVAPPADRAPAPGRDTPPDTSGAPTTSASAEALCGHASMNGRTCTRPAGHPQKSHRYS
ncbi:hypothetical protein [Nocardioides korecus]